MGSSPEEIINWDYWFRQQGKSLEIDNEGPQHRVRVTQPFYMGAHHVTVGQFGKFVADAGYQTDAEKGENKGALGMDSATGKFALNVKYSCAIRASSKATITRWCA